MTTIIRVKRHRAEDPVEALVLSCKRKKTEDSDSNLFEKVLNFSGTVEDKDDGIATSTVESFNKESKYSNLKKNHQPEIRSKQRQERRERSENNRFMLLSCLRSGKEAENTQDNPTAHLKENVTIVDVSKEISEELTDQGATEGSYVYDLYSVQDSDADFNDLYMENLLSVQPLSTELELEYRNGEDEEIDPDEDDSNDENNWRNDYPDTDYSSSGEDDSLTRRLKKCSLGGDNSDLGSESEGDEYLKYESDDDRYFYEIDYSIARRFMRNNARELGQSNDESEDDESEDDYRDCEEDCEEDYKDSD